MATKEEIEKKISKMLNEEFRHLHDALPEDCDPLPIYDEAAVKSAEIAKQQAVDFALFADDIFLSNGHRTGKGKTWEDVTTGDIYTTEQLYAKFIES